MKEIEILVEVLDEKDKVLESLRKFEVVGSKNTLDIYFFDPLRDDLKANVEGRLTRSFRLREKDGKCSVAYKLDNFNEDGIWIYSDEFETSVGDLKTGEQIINHLGLEELVRIDNTKHTFKTNNYEIVLEEVKG
jgi:predicted adenylyl cyclase CyaB